MKTAILACLIATAGFARDVAADLKIAEQYCGDNSLARVTSTFVYAQCANDEKPTGVVRNGVLYTTRLEVAKPASAAAIKIVKADDPQWHQWMQAIAVEKMHSFQAMARTMVEEAARQASEAAKPRQ